MMGFLFLGLMAYVFLDILNNIENNNNKRK